MNNSNKFAIFKFSTSQVSMNHVNFSNRGAIFWPIVMSNCHKFTIYKFRIIQVLLYHVNFSYRGATCWNGSCGAATTPSSSSCTPSCSRICTATLCTPHRACIPPWSSNLSAPTPAGKFRYDTCTPLIYVFGNSLIWLTAF